MIFKHEYPVTRELCSAAEHSLNQPKPALMLHAFQPGISSQGVVRTAGSPDSKMRHGSA